MNVPQIFLSTWAIKKSIESGERSVFDLPALAAVHKFQGVEIIDRHLPDLSQETFSALKKKLADADLHVSLGATTDFTADSPETLNAQIKYTKQLIAAASYLEAHSLRILLGGDDFFFQKWLKRSSQKRPGFSLENIKSQKKLTNWLQKAGIFHILHKLTIEAKKPRPLAKNEIQRVLRALDDLVPLAEKKKIPLAIENHWGISTLPENILFFLNHYSSDYLGVCLDLGNFSQQQNRYSESEKLLPFAKEIHAKSYSFAGDGEEVNLNYKRFVKLIREADFSGPIVVEYEGRGNQLQHSLMTRDLILKYWS